jgi:anti-sigma B factor antagonist
VEIEMNVHAEPGRKDVRLIAPAGRLDLASAAALRDEVKSALDEGSVHLLIDLGGVTFLDSSGLGALVGSLKAARSHGGDLRIARPGQQPQMILELTTLDRVLKPYATVEEALAEYSR